jgi:hypothetical protein
MKNRNKVEGATRDWGASGVGTGREWRGRAAKRKGREAREGKGGGNGEFRQFLSPVFCLSIASSQHSSSRVALELDNVPSLVWTLVPIEVGSQHGHAKKDGERGGKFEEDEAAGGEGRAEEQSGRSLTVEEQIRIGTAKKKAQ